MRIGFIGAGQMARALAKGFVGCGLVEPEHLVVADVSEEACKQFGSDLVGVTIAKDARAVVEQVDAVFLAVKPVHVVDVAEQVGEIPPELLFVSIAAGVTMDQLCKMFGSNRIVRVMPNTPCLINAGASAFCVGDLVTLEDANRVKALLDAVGISFQVPEALLDGVTGLSGSGPAFVFKFIEALSDGGVRVGLPRHIALQLAAQTVAGAAQMVLDSEDHPAVLKDRVTSPGGTTIAGVAVLEQGAFRGTVISAVEAASSRSTELGKSDG
ncbi:MAG: pyrroline-5-carboxylate reductase [Planctomycetaceae bacterium]|nr:pyrroline-5-carboxylate reductase [Planctomycetaceae bacterium]